MMQNMPLSEACDCYKGCECFHGNNDTESTHLLQGICLKLTGKSRNGFTGVFKLKGEKKSCVLSGNIPELPNGSVIYLSVNDRFIDNYDFELTYRNRKILEEYIYSGQCYLSDIHTLRDYEKKLNLHKSLLKQNVLWRDLEGKNLDNPYTWLPFSKADEAFFLSGHQADEPIRLTAINTEIRERFRKARREEYSLDVFNEAFREVEGDGRFQPVPNNLILAQITEGNGYLLDWTDKKNIKVRDKELFEANRFICHDIRQRSNLRYPLLSQEEIDLYFSKLEKSCNQSTMPDKIQLEAVQALLDSSPVAVTGSAGTGKTTVIKRVIDCFGGYYGNDCGSCHDKILLLAPTGKASRRMTECCGFPASTIHRALRKCPDDEFVFYNEKRKLPYQCIIIDECSMIGTLLMRDLLKAIPDTAKLYFVGDCNQLLPVECGQPFFDVITKELCPVVRLTRIYRQEEGTILRNAFHILNDEALETGDDFLIRNIRREEIPVYSSREIQCIAPYNEMVDYINKIGQEENRNEAIKGFKVGDKVIANKNTLQFCNGDLGVITAISEEGMNVFFTESVFIEKKDFDLISQTLSLAYAITVHKMQGSECDYLKIFIPKEAKNPLKSTSFISKSMLYTAITRARKRVGLYYYE